MAGQDEMPACFSTVAPDGAPAPCGEQSELAKSYKLKCEALLTFRESWLLDRLVSVDDAGWRRWR